MLTSVLVVCLTIAATSQEVANQPTQATRHDFGGVKEGTVVVHTFQIDRASPGASIARIELSRRGMTARVSSANENDRLMVTVTWDTRALDGPVEGEALVHWADSAEPPVRLTLTGIVKQVIAIEPFAAVFFSVYRDEGGERTVTIVNRDDKPLEITRLEPVGRHFAAAVQTLVPGQRYALVVRVEPGTELGRFQEGIVVHTNHATRPDIPVAVNVLVKPDVYASPEAVDFGQVELDHIRRAPALVDALTQVVGITRRQGPFSVTSVSSDVPGLDVTVSPSGASQTFRLDIRLVPARVERGDLKGAIRLGTSDPAFPEIVVPVSGMIR